MRKFISGFLLAAIIFTSVGVYASNSRTIEVLYNINEIIINKISKMPSDQNQKPFVYNGTTYVPLRFISENLGFPVNYDGPTRTISIGETVPTNGFFLEKDIFHMNHQADSWKWSYTYAHKSRTTLQDNLRNEYTDYLRMYMNPWSSKDSWQYLEFPLNGKYKTFTSTLGLTNQYMSTTATITVRIFADDNLIYSKDLKAGDMLTDVKLNVSNVLKLRFEMTAKSPQGNENTEIAFFNPVFYK